ncbi:MAG: hypothetical protein H6754_07110 [Candidatus Omnitrophica bacterium]|nr:hypothetical protein [Candidatus Omnitrophota bacterium]
MSFCANGFAADSAWKEIKDKHFVIYYEAQSDESLAKDLLRRAEGYYRKIGDEIGYSRTNKLWTWEERVQIFLFATQSSYLANTGQPSWSTGYADRDSRLFKSKTIMTYRQEEGFVDGLLPHEISHLILHDFIPNDERIPVWFDEGVAQMQEKDRRPMARQIMKTLTGGKQYVPFSQFVKFDVRREKDPRKAQIFYVQSLSVVDFLVTKFGNDSFRRLLRSLRDNKDFNEALFSTYSGVFKDLADFERKWILSFNH